MKKREKIRKVLLVFLISLIFTRFVWADNSNVTFKTKPDGEIRVDGDGVVWMSHAGGNWDIYYMDKATGVETQITKDPNTQGYPDIWKNLIVWQDNRDNKENGDFDIYLYDLSSGQEKKISNIEGNHQEPIIRNNKVVWVDTKTGGRDIMLYDIQSDTLNKISSPGAKAYGISFDGQVIAWMDTRGGDFDIYMYDINQKIEKQLTYGLGDELDPMVSNGNVVWMVEYNGVSQIYMYDTKNDRRTRLTVGTENHRPIAFLGDLLLVIEGNKLTLNSVNSITQQAIKASTSQMPVQAFLSGDKIVWFDGRNLITEKVSDAIDRALKVETNTNPPQNNSGSSKSGKSSESKVDNTQDDKLLVKASQDNLLSSPDGRLTLKISKGTLEEDIYITLNEEVQQPLKDYTWVTKTYGWKAEGTPKLLKPIEVTLNYKDIPIYTSTKKICIYSIDENKVLKPVTEKVNSMDKSLTAYAGLNGNAVLAIYDKSFYDMKKHWAYEIVDTIAAHHIINGYDDGSFKPDRQMSRAEFVKILVGSLHLDASDAQAKEEQVFMDVPDNHWAKEYINIAYERGWASGFQGKFNPNDSISREQMVSMLMRVYKDTAPYNSGETASIADLSGYKDKNSISAWAIDDMQKAVGLGIINGYENNLNPKGNATRAEAATILYRYLEKLGKL